MESAGPLSKTPAGREAEETRLAKAAQEKGIVKFREPVTHLFLDGDAYGQVVHVTVPVRIAKSIGADDIATMRQFLDAIERRGRFARYELEFWDERADDAGITWGSREALEAVLFGTAADSRTGTAAAPPDVVAEQEQ